MPVPLSRLVYAACFVWGCVTVQAAAKPNFLLFMADDMSYHDLGCSGNADVHTPHLDHFATQGTLFECTISMLPRSVWLKKQTSQRLNPLSNEPGVVNHR